MSGKMSLNYLHESLMGNPDSSGWSQLLFFNPEEASMLNLKGVLYALVSSKNQDKEIENGAVGKNILSEIKDAYYRNPKNTPEALSECISFVKAKYKLRDIEIAITVYVGGKLYFVATNGAGIEIKRDKKLVSILKTQGGELKSASGFPKEGDTYILGTNKLFKLLDTHNFDDILINEENIKKVTNALEKEVGLGEANGNLGLFLVKFGRNESFAQKPNFFAADLIDRNLLKAKQHFDLAEVPNPLAGIPLRKSENSIKFVFGKFADFVKNISKNKVYVVNPRETAPVNRGRKTSASVGFIILLLLVLSIFFGVRQKKLADQKAEYQTQLSEAIHNLSEAQEIYSLNPTRARELFADSKEKVDILSGEGIKDDELSGLVERLNELQGKILGEYRNEPEVFVDLTLLSNDFNGDSMVFSDEKLYVLDKNGKKIVSVAIDTKRSEVVSGPGVISSVEDIAVYADTLYLLNSEGIYKVGSSLSKVVDKDWDGETLLSSYASNLYLLEKNTSTIWRFTGTESGFASKKDWMAPGYDIDLTQTISFTIDGMVWTLQPNVKIIKFGGGIPQSVQLESVFPAISSPKLIFTNDENEHLYVLDSSNARVVVFDKEGKYISQYISDQIKNATSIAASEKENLIILLTGDKLLSIGLKNP